MKISNILYPVIATLITILSIFYLIYAKILTTSTWNNWDTLISCLAGFFILICCAKLGFEITKG